jgi:hypothetical protein
MDKRSFTLYASSLLSILRQESAPSGVVYAAFMTQGITLEEYTAIVDILKLQGLVLQTGNVLSLTAKGRTLASQIDNVLR